MYRDEAGRDTPRAIRKMLEEYGGQTPTGLPTWRLVRACDCRILCQGVMHHFPRGVEIDINTRPERIEGGQFLLPRYRDLNGWILQRWFPPSTWGTAEQWQSHRAEAKDTPLFAASFPTSGDYFMLGGPWATVEEAGDLRAAIQLWLRAQRENPRDLEAHVKGELAQEQWERRRQVERFAREMTAVLRTDVESVLKSASPAAQRYRDQMAAQAGVSGYMSAAENY